MTPAVLVITIEHRAPRPDTDAADRRQSLARSGGVLGDGLDLAPQPKAHQPDRDQCQDAQADERQRPPEQTHALNLAGKVLRAPSAYLPSATRAFGLLTKRYARLRPTYQALRAVSVVRERRQVVGTLYG
jgi:hypothetical protein